MPVSRNKGIFRFACSHLRPMRVKLLKMAFHMAGTMFGNSHATFSGLTVSVVYTHQRASPKHCTCHMKGHSGYDLMAGPHRAFSCDTTGRLPAVGLVWHSSWTSVNEVWSHWPSSHTVISFNDRGPTAKLHWTNGMQPSSASHENVQNGPPISLIGRQIESSTIWKGLIYEKGI